MSVFDLPDIQFVDVDPEKIKTEIITVYEAVSGRKLFPGDPVRLFLMTIADLIIQQRVLIDHSAKRNLLRYAAEDYLDHLGAFVETTRLAATAAVTTQRFRLSAVLPSAAPIPAGTRVSAGNEVFFATAAYAEIPPGALTSDIPVTCMEPGTIGNGYMPGQLSTLVDPLPYIAAVENLTQTSGGTNMEADDPYRERIHTSPERFSVAGPAGAYEYWARTAHPGIMDVRVYSPAPAEVAVLVLMGGGELPTQDILDAVSGVLNDRTIRPLTDRVTVAAPTVVPYTVNLQYWIDSENASEASTIQSSINQAVQAYVSWQKARIGRNIIPSELTRRIMNAGARRVEMTTPSYTVLDDTQIAIVTNPETDIIVTYGGIEDD
ncbi:baseplate J/gp47 family protein [Paenibacillaceae bacterium]|nr:baseplate J/gp47 family protein [Paenibacillaceae bacterium]